MALVLWYRNYKYDRILAPSILIFACIQLCIYGVYSGGSMSQAGLVIYLGMWIQPMLIALMSFGFFYSRGISNYRRISGWILVACTAVFVIAMLSYFFGSTTKLCIPDIKGEKWISTNSSGSCSMFYYWGWIYVILITIVLLILLAYYDWSDPGLVVTLFILWGTALTNNLTTYSINTAYIFCAIAFIVWLNGVFSNV